MTKAKAPPRPAARPIAPHAHGLFRRKCAGKQDGLQRKLSIGSSNDPLERDADRIAEQVLAGRPQAQLGGIPLAVQRYAGNGPEASQDVPPSVDRALAMPGSPLDPPLRRDMEARFGHDFSQVGVHRDAAAEQSARDVGAQAYTVGSNIVFGAGSYAPGSTAGRKLIAHELTHVLQQQGGAGAEVVQRAVADDIKYLLEYHWFDWIITDQEATEAFALLKNMPFADQDALLRATQGKYLERLRDKLPDHLQPALETVAENVFAIARLEREKEPLEALLEPKLKTPFSELGRAIAKLKPIEHELSIRKTGTGTHVGKKAAVKPAGVRQTDCTLIVLEILEQTFTRNDKEKEWAKIEKRYRENIAKRGDVDLSGLDIQAALVSVGWKGIYWAPDPAYLIPREELEGFDPLYPNKGIKPEEASYTFTKAKKGNYYKNFGKAGYPGVSISHTVVDYAPERPNEPRKPGYPPASATKKDTSQLQKLKKLPFGVMTGHGGDHMTILTSGKVIEVHWRANADNVALFEETDMEKWAIGSHSGYHFLASGAVVAPAADVDAAFK